jgi:GntR family transcriptional regulator
MAPLSIDPRHPTPIHAQLERAIRAAIATGRLEPNEQLPTVRQLAVQLQINANTVARVYTHLERLGLLETRRGVGTFVAARQPAKPAKDEAAARGFSADDVVRQAKELAGQQGG